MDNLTHTLFAVTLARTAIGRAGRGTTAALVLASNAADIDLVAAVRDGASYLQWHRGPTHGPLSLIALGVPTAVIVWLWLQFRDRRRDRVMPPRATFPALAAISILGVTLHLAMDFPTSYGSRSLSPFDWHWFGLDWMPIIDIYLLAALALGLLVGARSQRARRRNAAIVLVLMAANYGVRGAAHHEALVLGPRALEAVLPPRCVPQNPSSAAVERWPADFAITGEPARDRCLVEIAAIPTFLSPFTWRLIARLSNEYVIHDLNLLDARFPSSLPASRTSSSPTLHFPDQWTPPVTKAAQSRLGRIYLGFSRFPAASATVDPTGGAIVRWNDMRFVGGVRTLDQPGRRPAPFVAVVRIDPSGRIVEERLGR